MINADEMRERLLARQKDLEQSMATSRSNAEDAGQGDVQDEIDHVITAEAQTASFEIGSIEFRALEDVRDALKRLDDGTYGRCVLCDREIEEKRLRAIPETPYCREDAERLENEQANKAAPGMLENF